MIKLRNIFSMLFVCCAILLLTGCNKIMMFNPQGVIAKDELDLMITAVGLMLIIVIPVIIATFVIAYRYRASNTKAKYTPEFEHSAKLEAVWWTIPIIIIVILGTITWISTHKLDPYRPLNSAVKPVRIQVVSLEWRWLFIYPDQGIATLNFVEFPVNTPINFSITSDAPMNSFMIQQLAGQIYSMAGMQTQLHLMADQPGIYNGRSVSFSGDGFAGMTFNAKAVSASEFNQWVATVQKSSNPLTLNAYNNLVPPSRDDSVQYFSPVADNLFNNIIMKYMMPMPAQNMQSGTATNINMPAPASRATPNSDFKAGKHYNQHKGYISPRD